MIQLGHYALVASMLFCAYGMVVALVGGRTKNLALIRSAENSVIANAVLIGDASIALWVLFLRDEDRKSVV